jgi:L-alanine-DL-glutamate epimerase-like enolase superfamily enzyme
LLRAELDYEVPPPHLHQITDPIDDEGYVHVSQEPGLGIDYNWDYIDDNRI